MQKVNITLSLEDEKLRALETYLKMEGSTLQKKLEESVGQLYEQMVPKEVQKFVDALSGGKPKTTPKPKAKTEVKKEAISDEQS